MGSSSTEERKPSFFKVLLEDLDSGLEIPQACVGSFRSVPRKAVLRTQNGSWWVTVKKTCSKPGDDLLLRLQGRGWVDLVKLNGLRKGDILIFSFVGGSEFHVFPFGKTSCLLKPKRGNQPKNTSGSRRAGGPQFEVTLKSFNLFGLNVGADFVGRTGMERRKMVIVRDWKGREWPVKVNPGGGGGGGGVVLGDGWADFVERNALQVGMTCLIQSAAARDDDDDDDVFVLLVVSL